MYIIGIDPGPEHSGVVLLTLDPLRVDYAADEMPNLGVRSWLRAALELFQPDGRALRAVAIEGIGYQGEHTGASVHLTCRWIGRFEELAALAGAHVDVAIRADVARHFTLYRAAPKGAVHDALRTRFYPTGEMTKVKGTKKAPGPCYGVTGHAWDALAVAVAYAERSGAWIAPAAPGGVVGRPVGPSDRPAPATGLPPS